eukprot:5166929-Amphidinium_carterae.1
MNKFCDSNCALGGPTGNLVERHKMSMPTGHLCPRGLKAFSVSVVHPSLLSVHGKVCTRCKAAFI